MNYPHPKLTLSKEPRAVVITTPVHGVYPLVKVLGELLVHRFYHLTDFVYYTRVYHEAR